MAAVFLVALLAAACGSPSSAPLQTTKPTAAILGGISTAVATASRPAQNAPSGTATPDATQAPSTLSDAESTYLDRVDTLAERMRASPELSAFTQAMSSLTRQYASKGAFDPSAANGALAPALSFMNGITAGVVDLTPPPGFKGVQDELQAAVDEVNTFLKDSQAALAHPGRDTLNVVQSELANPFAGLAAVTADSAFRREKGSLGLPQVRVDGPLTAEETAYLNKVQSIVARMNNSKELSDALAAFGNDLDTLNTTGKLDGKSSSAARATAISFMSTLAPDVQALQPPDRLQGVQTELDSAVQLYTGGLNDWQSAVVSQKLDNIAPAFFQEIGIALAILQILGKDLAALGIKSS